MADELQFQVLDKVVSQGEQRLSAMFRETVDSLEEARARGLSPEEEAELEQVLEAYRLTFELAREMISFKDAGVLGLMGKQR